MQLNFVAPINTLSYGVCGTNFAVELSKKCELSLFPVNEFNIECPSNHIDSIRESVIRAAKYNPKAPSVRLWHQHNLALHAGTPRIGFPIFELDDFTDVEKHHIEAMDAIFVCSNWAASIIKNRTSQENVYVVPLGVDSTLFTPQPLPNGPTSFLITGKWEVRKAHEVVASVLDKFADRDIKVILACENPFCSQDENNSWLSLFRKLGDKVISAPRYPTQEEYSKLYSIADCILSPSRAEGWNLPVLEAMSCGRHVITTNYSAHTEFCNNTNSMLIDINELTTAHDGKFFKSGVGKWARIGKSQTTQMEEYINDIINKKESGNLKINQAGINTALKYSWSNVSSIFLESVLHVQSTTVS